MKKAAWAAIAGTSVAGILVVAGWGLAQERQAVAAQTSAAIVARPPLNFGVSVTDVEKSARWYEENLGMVRRKAATFPKGKVIILGAPNLEVEIIQYEGAVNARKQLNLKEDYLSQGIFKVGFYVDDLDATVARLKQHNVKFYYENGRDEELRLRFAIIVDSDGNTIQLFQPMK